jgi:two-component system nitrogen regulation response regulator NtrX
MSMALSEAVAQQPQRRVEGRREKSAASVLYVSCGGGIGRPGGNRDRAAVRDRLARLDVGVDMAADIPSAFERLAERRYTLCVLDLAAGRAAITAIRVIRAQHPNTFVVGVVDAANPVAAAEAIHAGFVDLLPWPFEPADVLALLANAEDRKGIEPEQFFSFGLVRGIVANSDAMQQAMLQVRRAAETRGGVLVAGEPGSGRRMLARAVHTSFEDGARRPFVVVDCGTDDPDALEMTLFGCRGESGSSTSPERVTGQSALVAARGGTLFLERLEDLPARLQSRLARVLRDREATLGDRHELIALDVRPMAAVAPNVDDAVGEGRLRRDLYDRMAQTRLEAPPLRRRREDIPVLATHLLRRQCTEQLCDIKTFSRSALALLAALPWRGNAAELQALVQTLCRTSRRLVIQLDDVLQHASLDAMGARLEAGLSLRDARMQFERDCISAVLVKHQGRVGDAAKALGIQRTNLYRKVRQLNVSRSLLVARR